MHTLLVHGAKSRDGQPECKQQMETCLFFKHIREIKGLLQKLYIIYSRANLLCCEMHRENFDYFYFRVIFECWHELKSIFRNH